MDKKWIETLHIPDTKFKTQRLIFTTVYFGIHLKNLNGPMSIQLIFQNKVLESMSLMLEWLKNLEE